MKHTLTTWEAADMLRSDGDASWSRAGALAMVEYLEELEDETGEPLEFDRIAIRCGYSEYASLEDWALEYFGRATIADAAAELGFDSIEAPTIDDAVSDWDVSGAIRDHIHDSGGTLIEFNGGVIVGGC